MLGKLKIIILILVILLASSLTIVFSIQNSRLKLLREYNQTRQKLESTLTESRQLQNRLEVIQRDLQRVSSEKNELQRKYDLVNKEKQELMEQAGAYTQLKNDLDFYKNENELLKGKVSSLQKEKLKLEADLNVFRQEEGILKEKIEEAKQILKQKTLLANYLEPQDDIIMQRPQDDIIMQRPQFSSINLPPIVISSQSSLDEGLSSSLEGEILNVNKEYNFVVIDLGQSRGVSEGMVFQVLRNDKSVGKIEVMQVRKDISACDIIQVNKSFKAGDAVRY